MRHPRRSSKHYDARGRRLLPRPPDLPEGMMYWQGELLKISDVERGARFRVGWDLEQHRIFTAIYTQFEQNHDEKTEQKLREAGL